jgi:hypothetical protein
MFLAAAGDYAQFENAKAGKNMCSFSLALPVDQLFSKVANSATNYRFFLALGGVRIPKLNRAILCMFYFCHFEQKNTMVRCDASSVAKMIGGYGLSCARAS